MYLDLKQKQIQILRQIYKSEKLEKYINILDLYADIDPKTFRNTIIYDLLQDFINYYKGSYQSFGNLIDEKHLMLRRELTFVNNPYVFLTKPKNDNEKIFQDTRLNKMLRGADPVIGLSGALRPFSKNGDLFCLTGIDPKEFLLQLLSRKKLPFAIDYSNIEISVDDLYVEHRITENYQLIQIDDSKENIFNSVDNFEAVNQMIMYTKINKVKIDYAESVMLLHQIEESKRLEELDNFSLI